MSRLIQSAHTMNWRATQIAQRSPLDVLLLMQAADLCGKKKGVEYLMRLADLRHLMRVVLPLNLKRRNHRDLGR
jgi:hypothetical protein